MLAPVFALLLAGSAEEGIVRAGGTIPKPQRIHYEDPLRVEPGITHIGIVILEVSVGEDGQPFDVAYVRGAGFKRSLDLEAVKRWRYAPTVAQGRPVKIAFRELIEMFPSPDSRAAFYAHAAQEKKESKGFRLFALEQLGKHTESDPEVLKWLKGAAADPDKDISAAASRVLESAK
jgi:hypothetical protein